jgi:hypothetical protein
MLYGQHFPVEGGHCNIIAIANLHLYQEIGLGGRLWIVCVTNMY